MATWMSAKLDRSGRKMDTGKTWKNHAGFYSLKYIQIWEIHDESINCTIQSREPMVGEHWILGILVIVSDAR